MNPLVRLALWATIFMLVLGCAAKVKPPPPPPAVVVPLPPPPPQGPTPEELSEQMRRLTADFGELQNVLARLVAMQRTQEERVAGLERRVGELVERARANAARPGFAPQEAPPPAPSPSTSVTTAPELYETAMTRLEAGDRDAAVLLFYQLVADHPNHPLRERAQVLLADVYYARRQYRAALSELESLLAVAPKGAQAADALLKIGLARRALGDEAGARRAWERLIEEHPQTEAARQARRLVRTGPRG